MPRIAPFPWDEIPPGSRQWMEAGLAAGARGRAARHGGGLNLRDFHGP
jgi:hypothetical protein